MIEMQTPISCKTSVDIWYVYFIYAVGYLFLSMNDVLISQKLTGFVSLRYSSFSHDRLKHCDAKFIHNFQSYFVIAYDCLNILFIVIGLERDFLFLLGDVQSQVLGTTIKMVSNVLDIILCVFNQGIHFDKKFLKDSVIPRIPKAIMP